MAVQEPRTSTGFINRQKTGKSNVIFIDHGLPVQRAQYEHQLKRCAHVIDENGSPKCPEPLFSSDPFNFRDAETDDDIFGLRFESLQKAQKFEPTEKPPNRGSIGRGSSKVRFLLPDELN